MSKEEKKEKSKQLQCKVKQPPERRMKIGWAKLKGEKDRLESSHSLR